jgi:hypothetical protein
MMNASRLGRVVLPPPLFIIIRVLCEQFYFRPLFIIHNSPFITVGSLLTVLLPTCSLFCAVLRLESHLLQLPAPVSLHGEKESDV